MIAVEAVKDQMMSGYGNPIWDTGATLQSVNYEAGDKSVAFGTGTSYAPFVHDGTYRMVARPFIADVINDSDFVDGIRDVIEEQLQAAVK